MAGKLRGSGKGQLSLSRQKSFKLASALSHLSNASYFSAKANESGFGAAEPRCVKYSPSVKPRTLQTSVAKHDFEALMWTGAFESLGQLGAMGLKDEQPFCRLNEAPYHCPCFARVFQASFGKKMQPESRKKTEEKEVPKKPSTYLTIGKLNLPPNVERLKADSVPKWLLYGQPRKESLYLPPSSVRIRWGKDVVDNVDVICDWLIRTFGPFLFIIREGPKSMVVVYEDVWTPFQLVNAGIPPRRLHVSWCDVRFYNFGHLNGYAVRDVFDNEFCQIFWLISLFFHYYS